MRCRIISSSSMPGAGVGPRWPLRRSPPRRQHPEPIRLQDRIPRGIRPIFHITGTPEWAADSGGCPLVTAGMEFANREGPVHDALVGLYQRSWIVASASLAEGWGLTLTEADYRGERFRDHPRDLRGNTDLICLTRPDIVAAIHGAYLDAGADIIIGNHAHYAAAMEVYEGKPIWYALGNFVFDQTWSEPTMEGITLELTFHGKELVQARMRPHIILDKAQPNFLDPNGDGRVVMISSIMGRITTPLTGWYQGAKHALEAVTDALRMEAASSGVKVVLVEPGGFKTGIWEEFERDITKREAQGSRFVNSYRRSLSARRCRACRSSIASHACSGSNGASSAPSRASNASRVWSMGAHSTGCAGGNSPEWRSAPRGRGAGPGCGARGAAGTGCAARRRHRPRGSWQGARRFCGR